jgi:hypothetical protein
MDHRRQLVWDTVLEDIVRSTLELALLAAPLENDVVLLPVAWIRNLVRLKVFEIEKFGIVGRRRNVTRNRNGGRRLAAARRGRGEGRRWAGRRRTRDCGNICDYNIWRRCIRDCGTKWNYRVERRFFDEGGKDSMFSTNAR